MLKPKGLILPQGDLIICHLPDIHNRMYSLDTIYILERETSHKATGQIILNLEQIAKLIDQMYNIFFILKHLSRIGTENALDFLVDQSLS